MQSRTKRTFENEHSTTNKRTCRRSEIEKFDFTKQCFHCGKMFWFDIKHTDRKLLEGVAKKDIGILSN